MKTCRPSYCRISCFRLGGERKCNVTSLGRPSASTEDRASIVLLWTKYLFRFYTARVATNSLQMWRCIGYDRLLQCLKLCFPLNELGRERFVVLGSTPLNCFVGNCTGTIDSTVNVFNSTKVRVRCTYAKLTWWSNTNVCGLLSVLYPVVCVAAYQNPTNSAALPDVSWCRQVFLLGLCHFLKSGLFVYR